MVTIAFRSGCTWTRDEIVVEPPYENLGWFIANDVQRSVASSSRLIEMLKRVIAGVEPPLVDETGNAWTMDIDPNVARLTCFFATPVAMVELPTAWLVDALERWRDHLIAQGRPADV